MNHRYITIDRDSPDHESYLKGTFSSKELALPVPLLTGTAPRESTTFQLIESTQVKRPSLALVLVQLLRIDLGGLTLVPALLVWLYVGGSTLDIAILTLSLACVHAATFAFNDYYDHMHGRDRLSEVSGSRVIQNGYLRAHEVFKLAVGLALVAAAGAIFFSIQNPRILIFALLGFALFSIGTLYSRFGFKKTGLGEFAVIIGLGPLFTTAVEFSLTERVTPFILYVGLVYGILSLLYVQSKSLVTSMVDHQAGVRTLAVRLGFDRMKKVMLLELALGAVAAAMIEPFYSLAFILFFVSAALLARFIYMLPSPVSSRARNLSGQILVVHALWSASLLIHYVMSR